MTKKTQEYQKFKQGQMVMVRYRKDWYRGKYLMWVEGENCHYVCFPVYGVYGIRLYSLSVKDSNICERVSGWVNKAKPTKSTKSNAKQKKPVSIKKYELTDDPMSVVISGKQVVLYQIRALRDFVCQGYPVHKGDLGGYVESKRNLSQVGNCWVSGLGYVYGNGYVWQNARVSCAAEVYGNARVSGNAYIGGNAHISGTAKVDGNTRLTCGELTQ
jgi:hypothetical protein